MQEKIKIFITDDHQIMLDGLKSILVCEPTFEIVGEALNGVETLKKLETITPDVLLMDLIMPRMDGLETTKHIRKRYPHIKIIILTTNDEGSIITSIFKQGASGFLLKNTSSDVLINSIHQVYKGKKILSSDLTQKILHQLNTPPSPSKTKLKLTKREKDVLKLIAKEKTTAEIASQLFISTHTVISHRRNLLVKFDVKTSVGLVKKALESGIL